MPLSSNLTGEQIQQLLDLFLYKAIEPVVLNTDLFDDQVSYILGLISSNRKRKPSSLNREKVINLLCLYLVTDDRKVKFDILRQARLERFFLHVFLSRLLKKFKDYATLYNTMVTSSKPKLIKIKNELDLQASTIHCNRKQVYRVVNVSSDYLASFYDCRTLILDHYVKLASRQAKIYTDSNKGNFDFFDVRQSILKSILLALDKYDSSKGALTSYINWWILNAQTCGISEHEYGIAYTVPQAQRKRIALKDSTYANYSISMDDVSKDGDSSDTTSLHNIVGDTTDIVKTLEEDEELNTVCYLAKCVDSRGIARLFLDIGEFFNERERSIMLEQTQRELKSVNKL